MSFTYTFEVVTARRFADTLIRAVAKHLVPQDKARLLTALTHGSEKIMQSVERTTGEFPFPFAKDEIRPLCLTFLFPLDKAIAGYESIVEYNDLEAGRVAIGCVDSSIECGEQYALFSCTGVTSNMSLLFQDSESIQNTFVQIAKDSSAALVILKNHYNNLIIWPILAWPAVRFFKIEGSWGFGLDHYCSALLTGAGIKQYT